MKTTNTLTDIQNKESIALEIKHDLENMFTEITGSTPHIINPEGKPFAVFYPKGRDEYIAILNALQPVKDAELKFAGKDPVQTFSPYLVDYGGKHSTPNYMTAKIRFAYSICPVWIELSGELLKGKFEVSTLQGRHIGFGNYERLYTLHGCEGKTSIQQYYGDNKTMYAKDESEREQLKNFIFS